MTDLLLLIVITALAALCIVLLVILSVRRKSGKYDVGSLFESINRRLDQVERMSAQVGNISDIFLIPQARGGFGELLLEDMIRTWLPPKAYSFQHRFSSGVRADAVIRLDRYLVAVDAKFPLESLKREFQNPSGDGALPSDIRRAFLKHITDISEKYIVPEENTLSFALMYVPSERVYYEAFVRRDSGLMEEALKKNVVPVSPGSIFLYLQTVAFGLKGFAFPSERKNLLQLVYRLRQDMEAFSKLYTLTGSHMRNMQKAYDESLSRLRNLEHLSRRLEQPDTEEAYQETRSEL